LHVLPGGASLEDAGGAGEEAQVVDHHRHLVVLDGFDRLAGVQRLETRDLIAVLLEHVGDRQERLRALGGRRVRPAAEGPPRGLHGAIDVLRGRPRGARDLLAGGGVQDRFGLPVGGDGLAVDEVAEDLCCGCHLGLSWSGMSIWVRDSAEAGYTRPVTRPSVKPSASATAGWVISPARTFRPLRRPWLRSSASSTPRSASSIRYGRVAFVSA